MSSSSSSRDNENALVNTVNAALDWNDRIGLQASIENAHKGWQVLVDWRDTPYGAGLFATQDIVAGSVLRRGVIGTNLVQFHNVTDIETFCCRGEGKNNSDDEYFARLHYVKDYLWGFYMRGTDERGYYQLNNATNDNDNRFYGMWIPGNGLNHSNQPNTVYRATAHGIDLIALQDIERDTELTDDYRRHGLAPPWLQEWAGTNSVTLNFANCNDFVIGDENGP